MDSSGGMKRNTRDFHLVYVRRRKGSGSRKRVSDPNENISFHSESYVPRTDGSREIGHDGISIVLLSLFLWHALFIFSHCKLRWLILEKNSL